MVVSCYSLMDYIEVVYSDIYKSNSCNQIYISLKKVTSLSIFKLYYHYRQSAQSIKWNQLSRFRSFIIAAPIPIRLLFWLIFL